MAKARLAETAGTRAKLLDLLCTGSRTTSELAREMGMSANGVRGHLGLLEQDGLVTHASVRRGVGKPAHEYRLTAEGSLRMSRAYLPVLAALLATLAERSSPEENEGLLCAAGRRLAFPRQPHATLRSRADAAVALLGTLGAVSTVREEEDRVWIEGACCPLRALVREHPLACKAVESMLEEHIGQPVQEQCDRKDPPVCRFAL